jgi:Spy/CpxP family protein refolding chaperone
LRLNGQTIRLLEGGEKMKKLALLLISVLFVMAAVSSSYAEFRGVFRNKKIAKELKLSDEQIETIKELAKNTEKKMIQLRADMEMKEIDLRDLLDEDAPNEAKAIELVKDIMELKTEQKVLKIKELIKVKKTLTPEQI